MDIRQMNKTNLEHWRGLRKQLWPGHPDDAHLADGEEILQADHLASFIAMADGVAIGFADASIRHDYVNGCDSSPVAFLEGIFVLPSYLLRWQTGWRLALRMPQSATIMLMAVTVRPWLSLKVFLFSPRSVNAA